MLDNVCKLPILEENVVCFHFLHLITNIFQFVQLNVKTGED